MEEDLIPEEVMEVPEMEGSEPDPPDFEEGVDDPISELPETSDSSLYDDLVSFITDQFSSLDLLDDFKTGLNDFYINTIEPSVPVQIFESFTYGEMTIALLLTCLVVLFSLKWLWEVLR